MESECEVSRRAFVAGVSAFVFGAWSDPPAVTKRVEKLYKIAGCRQPNDLQFVSERGEGGAGLWVLDQVDPNKAFKVRPEDGSIIQELQTESIHGSGITY